MKAFSDKISTFNRKYSEELQESLQGKATEGI